MGSDSTSSSWGLHLWDKSEEVFAHTCHQVSGLTTNYAKLFKEFGELERDYARGVRKLCNKYAPKQEVSSSSSGGNVSSNLVLESDRDKGLRLILTELGFKAGQHEVLAELYTKSLTEDLKVKVKEANKEVEKLRKELKRSQEVTDHVKKSHEKYNIKYQKCLQDAVLADKSWHHAQGDRSLSRRDVERLRSVAVEKQKQCDESQRILDRHSANLQEVTNSHLHRTLPNILDGLQSLSVHTGNYLNATMLRAVSAEVEATKVISSCNDEMVKIINNIQPHVDTERLIEMYKTGAVPTVDTLDQAKVDTNNIKTMKKSKSLAKLPTDKDCQNAYQNKRKIESKIEALEEEIAKGHKEMSGLQLMVKTYTENPQYGDVRQFRAELDKTTHNVQLLESELYSLNSQLKEVNDKLHVSNAVVTRVPEPEVCDKSDTTSQSSGYPSSASSGDVDSHFSETGSTRDSQFGETGSTRDSDICSTRGSQFGDTESYRDTIQSLLEQSPGYYRPYQNIPLFPTSDEAGHEQPVVEDLPPPPDDMLGDETDGGHGGSVVTCDVVVALYSFEVLSEGNISMTEGERFYRLGCDDGGWIRVRRLHGEEEGFVPTSFLQMI